MSSSIATILALRAEYEQQFPEPASAMQTREKDRDKKFEEARLQQQADIRAAAARRIRSSTMLSHTLPSRSGSLVDSQFLLFSVQGAPAASWHLDDMSTDSFSFHDAAAPVGDDDVLNSIIENIQVKRQQIRYDHSVSAMILAQEQRCRTVIVDSEAAERRAYALQKAEQVKRLCARARMREVNAELPQHIKDRIQARHQVERRLHEQHVKAKAAAEQAQRAEEAKRGQEQRRRTQDATMERMERQMMEATERAQHIREATHGKAARLRHALKEVNHARARTVAVNSIVNEMFLRDYRDDSRVQNRAKYEAMRAAGVARDGPFSTTKFLGSLFRVNDLEASENALVMECATQRVAAAAAASASASGPSPYGSNNKNDGVATASTPPPPSLRGVSKNIFASPYTTPKPAKLPRGASALNNQLVDAGSVCRSQQFPTTRNSSAGSTSSSTKLHPVVDTQRQQQRPPSAQSLPAATPNLEVKETVDW